jgi:hypothetical protein
MPLSGIETLDLVLPKTTKRLGISHPNGGKTLSLSVGQIVKFAPKGIPHAEVFLQVWVMDIAEYDTQRNTVKIAYQGKFTPLTSRAPLRIQFLPARRSTAP